MQKSPILIIGKNGKTGARVNQRLQALGYATRPVSRSSTPAFDWDNPATWESVVKGVDSAYITYQPDLAVPKAEKTIQKFVQLAIEHGVNHIVLLSGRGEEGAQRAEDILKHSDISWNIVRCSWFFQNFSESFMLDGILDGNLVLPASDTVEPFVDADDIADVVVATLTEPGHTNKLYELTGPQALSFAQCIQTISRALGRPVNYCPVPVDTYIDALREQGVPEDMQWLLRELFTEVLDGRNSHTMNGIEEALGRPPVDFETYISKTIASGIWAMPIQQETA